MIKLTKICLSAPASVAAYLAACMMAAPGAGAHPLGNFTVNHFTRLRVDPDRIDVHFVVDMAEIPAFGELRKLSSDDGGNVLPGALQRYASGVGPEYLRGLSLTVDRDPVPLHMSSAKASVAPGAGGLQTLRLEFDMTSPLSGESSRGSGPHQLLFLDRNQTERIGWHEITVTSGRDVGIFNSSAFSNSASGELHNYPPDMLASPLEERSATLEWTNGTFPTGASPLKSREGVPVRAPVRDRLAELIAVKEITPSIFLLGILIAGILGALHALSPGHGKTVVGAYLVGSRGTPKHAAFLGLTVTITHTAGVFALGLITLFFSKLILPDRLFPALSFFSGALVAAIGFNLFIRRIAAALGIAVAHSHSQESFRHHRGDAEIAIHGLTHAHAPGERPHSHMPAGNSLTWRNLLALGISGGLLPCPSALVVMLSAIALHRVAYGLLLVLAFSAGLAATLTAVGLTFVYAGRWLSNTGRLSRVPLVQKWFPVTSALAVGLLGIGICFESLVQANINPLIVGARALASAGSALSGQAPLASLGAFAILGLGLLLGFKHATEADHVVAVSNIVSEHRRLSKAVLVGGLWGLGHTLTLLLVGLCVLILRIAIPERIANYLEFAVALMIIILSGSALLRALRKHQQSKISILPGSSASVLTSRAVGLKPLLVGAMHGLAGSSALTLLVLSQVPSVALGLGYLFLFGLGSILGMMVVSLLIGLPFALGARRLAGATLRLQAFTGSIGVCFGCWYAFSVGASVFAI